MGVIDKDEFNRLMKSIYESGGDPEFVVGKCPHCGEPFEYWHGLKHGHLASQCPKMGRPISG